MPALKKFAAAAAISLCALTPSAALAANVLYLSTAEWGSTNELKASGCAPDKATGISNDFLNNDGSEYRSRSGAQFIFGTFNSLGNSNSNPYYSSGAYQSGSSYSTNANAFYSEPLWSTGTRRSRSALKALRVATVASGGTFYSWPGVLSPGAQIDKAPLFNGTVKAPMDGGRSNNQDINGFIDARGNWEATGKDTLQDVLENKLYPGDIIVVQAGYQLIEESKATALVQKMMAQKGYDPNDATCGIGKGPYPDECKGKGLTFVLLLDTCDQCGYDGASCKPAGQTTNLKYFMGESGKSSPANSINGANSWMLKYSHLGLSLNVTNKKDPYSVSAYAGEVGLAQLQGNTTGSIQCAPKQNVLFQSAAPSDPTKTEYKYTGNGYTSGWYCNSSSQKDNSVCTAPIGCPASKPNCPDSEKVEGGYGSTWPELNASSAYGMIIPFWQNNRGLGGACIYLGVDNNIFDNGRDKAGCDGSVSCGSNDRNMTGQHQDVAEMFLSLPEKACKVDQQTANLGECKNLQPGETCQLGDPHPSLSKDQYDVLETLDENGNLLCPGKVWVKAPPPSGGAASVPTTGWPALLGLSALLPLLAARRRRRE